MTWDAVDWEKHTQFYSRTLTCKCPRAGWRATGGRPPSSSDSPCSSGSPSLQLQDNLRLNKTKRSVDAEP